MIRSAYDGSRVSVVVKCPEVGKTLQAFRDECNINTIMQKYQRTGLVEAVSKIQPQYADVAGFDFHQAMDQVVQAQNMFDELPSSIRKRFGNSPAAFVDFVSDPENLDECVRIGLIQEPPVVEAPVAPEGPPAPGQSPAPGGSSLQAPSAPSSAAG